VDKKIISVEIPTKLREALRREAFNRDLTISAIIRELLEERLKEIDKEFNIKVDK